MAEPVLPADLREFLRLLNEAGVEYLLIGGYAVGYHGYPRATADMDVWERATGRHKDLDDLEHLPKRRPRASRRRRRPGRS